LPRSDDLVFDDSNERVDSLRSFELGALAADWTPDKSCAAASERSCIESENSEVFLLEAFKSDSSDALAPLSLGGFIGTSSCDSLIVEHSKLLAEVGTSE